MLVTPLTSLLAAAWRLHWVCRCASCAYGSTRSSIIVFFRKRHENELALRLFASEADEFEAVARIARSVAVSLDVLERSVGGQQDQLLAAIKALPDAIAQRLRLTT